MWATTTLLVVASWPWTTVADYHFTPSDNYPNLPDYGPQPNPPYMVDNQNNFFNVAPDNGSLCPLILSTVSKGRFSNPRNGLNIGTQGAVWLQSGSFDNYMHKLRNTTGGTQANQQLNNNSTPAYWLTELAPLGQKPLAYKTTPVFRNVVDYGADPTGQFDSTEAINAAVEDDYRCGPGCGSTFTDGAIVYFPPGRYKICRPIIQYYYTQFIGHPLDKPVIVGCNTFRGIALIDTDPYVPGGAGKGWYINQNQFFRQIRNMIFDLTEMPLDTTDNGGVPYVPTGIHWQVSQATSLQYLEFRMPVATSNNTVNHVGIFTENGSGGFVSNLLFNGGSIGWRAGSQQYTAQNLIFNNTLTAVQMVWDWGWNWQGIIIDGAAVGFNISGHGGDNGTGIGSVSIIDCVVRNVPVAILTNRNAKGSPSIVIDNLVLENVQAAVQTSDTNEVVLSGAQNVDLWALGWRYNGSTGVFVNGSVAAPRKAQNLLGRDGKSLFTRCRPGYEMLSAQRDFLVATREGIMNDGTGDQTAAINTFLAKAVSQSKVAFFPAGIYQVQGTVFVPVGSKVQGSLWSQIMGTGPYFSNASQPQVMVKVGNPGDIGTMEIVEMLFTVKGATAGAILMEWNVHEIARGAAGMWDSHFRVGGALKTNLTAADCPKQAGFNLNCVAASLMLHVTGQASGYFENVWAWAADHDGNPRGEDQLTVYAGRGMLIESSGPSWFYGTGSEHSALYQYQLYKAQNIYLGHVQTESPYYQPYPRPPFPFPSNFPADPSFFEECELIEEAFGLRILSSDMVTVHSAGLYSFYRNYSQSCVHTHNCQKRILEVRESNNTAIFNIFTVGVEDVANGVNGDRIFQYMVQNGFTTEVSVWVPTPGMGVSVPNTCPTPSPVPFPTTSMVGMTSTSSKTTSTTSTKASTTSAKTSSTVAPKPTATAWPDCTTDKCKIDAGNRCNCTDTDTKCKDASPECCKDNSCAPCICGHAGECAPGSPTCCDLATCYWACGLQGDNRVGCPDYVPNGWNPPPPPLPGGNFVVKNESDGRFFGGPVKGTNQDFDTAKVW
ncbi:Pectate lyase superfamily domain containing protein [Naviculisporaceae sp. PSN 640]